MSRRKKSADILKNYELDKVTVATICSHSSLQIFHGARKEGFRTLGIAMKKRPRYFDGFPKAKPDEFLILDDYVDIFNYVDELLEKNVIVIPHGSFVEYLGTENFIKLPIPSYGNKNILPWESNRKMEREWLESAGIDMPKSFKNPREINIPVLVKYHGAKGGKGFFIAKNYEEFKKGIDHSQSRYAIQEYLVGTRYYIHYFYSPLVEEGYRLSKGSLQILSMDRRDESNIDEMYKLGSQERLKDLGFYPSFVVTGNVPVVLRESLLERAFSMGAEVVERSLKLIPGGGMVGPFCLETVVTDKLDFKVFEISARIVAGTNPFVSGSPYADYIQKELSTGQRIAQEIKLGIELGRLEEIIS